MALEYQPDSFCVTKRLWRGSNRILAMLTRLAMKFAGVAESDVINQATVDYEYEHRFAEYEDEDEDDRGLEPEQSVAREAGLRADSSGRSVIPPA